MAGWITTSCTTSTSNLISTVAVDSQYQFAGIWGSVLQKRTVTTTTNKWVGVAYATATTDVPLLGDIATYPTVTQAYMIEPIGGGCDVIQVLQSDSGWVTI